MDDDLNVLNSIIRKRDPSLLQKLLNEKSFDNFHCNNDGWYPLHEAVDLGCTDIAKQIISHASKKKVDILKEWDQATTSSPKYSCNLFKEVVHDDEYLPDYQISFIRLAVRTEQMDLVKLFIKLYKKKHNFQLDIRIRLSLIPKLLMLPRISRAYILRNVDFNNIHNPGIFEAMLESVSRPEILRVLLEAFPEYIGHPKGECGILQLALKQNELETVTLLLPLICDLNYDMIKTRKHHSFKLYSIVDQCLNWTNKHDDLTILKCFFNARNKAKFLNYDTSKHMYYMLYSACCHSTAKTVQYLVEVGLNVYTCYFTASDLLWSQEIVNPNCSWMFNIGEEGEFSWVQFRLSSYFWAAVHNNVDVLKYLISVLDLDEFCYRRLLFPIEFVTSNLLFEPLHLFLEAGCRMSRFFPGLCYKGLTNEFESLLLNEKQSSLDMLRVYVKFGGVEVVLSCWYNQVSMKYEQYYSPRSLSDLLKWLWFSIDYLIRDHQDSNNPDRRAKADFVLSKFEVFLQLTGTFSVRLGGNPCLERTIPTLQQICRFFIRSLLIEQEHQSLKVVNDLPLPALTRKYLLCS